MNSNAVPRLSQEEGALSESTPLSIRVPTSPVRAQSAQKFVVGRAALIPGCQEAEQVGRGRYHRRRAFVCRSYLLPFLAVCLVLELSVLALIARSPNKTPALEDGDGAADDASEQPEGKPR